MFFPQREIIFDAMTLIDVLKNVVPLQINRPLFIYHLFFHFTMTNEASKNYCREVCCLLPLSF